MGGFALEATLSLPSVDSDFDDDDGDASSTDKMFT